MPEPPVKILTLSGRGPNTMSLATLESLEEDLAASGGEPLLVTGAGGAFSSGLDLDALAELGPDGVRRLLVAMERVVLALFLHPAPTVACVNGHAVAGGCLVAQACDVRIAPRSERLRMGMTGVAVGLRYPPWVFAVLGTRLAETHLQWVLLGARTFGVEEALERGLLDEVVPPDELQDRARSELSARSALNRAAYASAKADLRQPRVAQAASRREAFEAVVPSWTAALRRR